MPAHDRLRVAIDARYWRSAIQTGVERYILLLLEALAAVGNDIEVGVVLREAESHAFPARAFPNVRLLWVADRRTATLNRAIGPFSPTLVHFPFEMPSRLAYPSVLTLHDPGRYLYPELMVRTVREVQNNRLRDQLNNPSLRAVITVSNASKTDIVAALGEPPRPLLVVPNFVASDFANRLHHARDHHPSTAKPFLLAVGVYIPTKNVPRLCRAFRLARQLAPETVPPRLILAGRLGWERRFPINGARDITVLGHVSDADLATLYGTCTAFVFPSIYEGFGIPVHEALMAGAPVLCSDIPVFHEIAGDLVHYAAPHDDKALAEAIVTRCREPGPPPAMVDRLLAAYTPAAAGKALIRAYRTAL